MVNVSAVRITLALALTASGVACTRTDLDNAGGSSSTSAGHALAPSAAQVHYLFDGTPAQLGPDLATSIAALEKIAAQPPESPMDLSELAELYVKRATLGGDPSGYVEAEKLANRSLAIMPQSNAVLILAKIHNARHQFREAIEIAEEYLKHASSVGAMTILATAYLALGELPGAAKMADAAVNKFPGSSTYQMRALVMAAQGRDEEASFDFARAVALEGVGELESAVRTRALWGRFLIRRGELAGAHRAIDEALRIQPGAPLALAQSAELALREGHADEARAKFEQAFATSRQIRYLIDLARAQELGGDAAGADSTRAQAEKLVRADLATSNVGHQLDLVEILLDRGTGADIAEALTLAQEEVTRRPSAETRFQLARALLRSGRQPEAEVAIQGALALGARDARMFELAARAESGPRSQLYAREAQALDPGNHGWRTLGMEVVKSIAQAP